MKSSFLKNLPIMAIILITLPTVSSHAALAIRFLKTAPKGLDTPVCFCNFNISEPGDIHIRKCNIDDEDLQAFNNLTGNNEVAYKYPTPGITSSLDNKTKSPHEVSMMPGSLPIADFSSYGSLCERGNIYFDDLSQSPPDNNIISWNWNFGDLTSGVNNTSDLQSPMHSYTTSGTYDVTLIITNAQNQSSTVVRQVTVYPAPVTDFTVSASDCASQTVNFKNTCSTSQGFINVYDWDFGDGITQRVLYPDNPDVSHTYTQPGSYNVKLNIGIAINPGLTDSCFSSVSKQVTAPYQFANFYSLTHFYELPILFIDSSFNNGTGNIVAWKWDFGDVSSGELNSSTLQYPPDHIYNKPGTYSVTLTVKNSGGCSSTKTRQITLYYSPMAIFSFSEPVLNEPVQFTDHSLVPGYPNIVTWLWHFGDGDTSTLLNPLHTFTIPGYYTVSLSVTESYFQSVLFSTLYVPAGLKSIFLTGKAYTGIESLSDVTFKMVKVDESGFPVSSQSTLSGIRDYFKFVDVPEGNYYLQAYPKLKGHAASLFLPTYFPNSVDWEGATLLNLGQAQNLYDIQLEPYTILKGGTLTINGQLLNSGKSLNPAEQEILLLDNQNNPVRWTLTDLAGNYSFDSLPAGIYNIKPVITGLTSYPFAIDLNENTSPAFVKMYISGQVITGISEIEMSQNLFKIYPNPSHDIINIGMNGSSEYYSVEIINSSGKILKTIQLTDEKNTIQISNLPSGLYLIRTTDKKGSQCTQRFIKQ